MAEKRTLGDILEHGYFMQGPTAEENYEYYKDLEERMKKAEEEYKEDDVFSIKDIFVRDTPNTEDIFELSEGFTLSPITLLRRYLAKKELEKKGLANGGMTNMLGTGGITGNKTYHQYHDQFVPIDSEGAGYANGGGVGTMMQPKKNFEMQGGVRNYLGKQKEVKAPLKWQSSPNHPTTELAYITKKEKDLLVKSDLHGSLKNGVNKGPSGIMSLNGYGSIDSSGRDVGMSGAATSDAEAGRNTSNTLSEGASYKDVQDYRSAAINAGAGQRVNPGFFDSRTNLTPEEIALAKSYRNDPSNIFAKQAYKNTGQTGLRSFISGGGILGALVRGLGQKFGLGKKAGEATYDMSEFSDYGIGGTPPGTLDFDPNAKIQDTSFITENIINKDLVPPSKPKIKNIDVGFDDLAFENDLMAKLNTLETREYNTLKTGKELDMNSPKQNERLEELEQKKNEANIIGSSTAIV